MKATEFLREYYEKSEDEVSHSSFTKIRRPRLTLKHLNKLRKMRNLEQIEYDQRVKNLTTVYGNGGEEE